VDLTLAVLLKNEFFSNQLGNGDQIAVYRTSQPLPAFIAANRKNES
jgi:hypothetical protein